MNYYKVLEIPETSTEKEIKKSYKRLVKKYHPDVFDGDKETADKKIKELNEAYETLSDSKLKKIYDESLHTASSIDFSSNNSVDNFSKYKEPTPDQKYEDLYRYDYYKRYTTNYYGVSRDDLKEDKKQMYNKKKKEDESSISVSNRLKIVICAGIALVIILIVLIFLLSYIRNLIKSTPKTSIGSSTLNSSLPYITFGMTFDEVRDSLGSPDFTEDKKNNMYAYWGNSYIIFDSNNIVIGWKNNNGNFYTDTVTGEDFTDLQEFYNLLLTY